MNKTKLVKAAKSAIIAITAMTILSGCANENAPNPFGVERANGDPPKEELLCIRMDCCGIYNGKYQPQNSYRGQGYRLYFTGDWTQIQQKQYSNWYIATTDQPGARVDICATMTRCLFDFFDYEMYDNPGTIELQLDGQPLGTYSLARKDSKGNKILEYVIATQKNTCATASVVLKSGRMTLSAFQVHCFNKRWPYGQKGPIELP